MSNHQNLNKTLRHVFIALIAVSIPFISCKEEKPAELAPIMPSISGIVLFSVGEVFLVKQDQTETPIEIQAKVTSGDTMRTGAKSFATVQFADKGLVRIQENTTLSISDMFSTGTGELILKEGQVLTKINKLIKGEQFKIKTPTAVASVRGTEYSTTYTGGKSVIAVKNGKVAVATRDAAEEGTEPAYTEKTVVDEGSAAVVTSEGEGAAAVTKVETRPISEVENLTVKKVSIIPMVTEPEKASKSELEGMQRDIIAEEVKIDKELNPKIKNEKIIMMIERKTNTLAEIREVFERIDEISLYNGRVIQGAIISRGAKYQVLTPTGATNINEADIKKVRVIK
jgi:hypothetical protein